MKTPGLISGFKSAIGFITILPAGRQESFSPMGMIRFFPLVGLIIGVCLAIVDTLASFFWPFGVAAVVDVLFLVIVTGAFHLDGVGDTADGIFSHRSKERALEIMKDSRSGMMGLVAVFSVLSLKVAGIYAIKTSVFFTQAMVLLVTIPALSRSTMLFGIRCLPYGREKMGTGKELFTRKLTALDFIFFPVPLVALLLLTGKGWLLLVVFLLLTAGILAFYRKKLGCITGDMLGAMTEVSEAVFFLAAGIQMM